MTEPPKKTAVFLLTYGEPGNLNLDEHFAYSLSILKRLTLKVAPIPKILLRPLALYRAWQRRRFWKRWDYRSNLESITESQAERLEVLLSKNDSETTYEVTALYEFRSPNLLGALAAAQEQELDRIVVVPLYVVDSDFTSGISKSDVELLRNKFKTLRNEPYWINQRGQEKALADLMVRFVEEELKIQGWNQDKISNAALVLGSHGTLLEGPPGLDTGLGAFRTLYGLLEESLGPRFSRTTVGWLNHSLGGEWTRPALSDAVSGVIQGGINKLVYFPFGFLADSAETELESRMILEEHPGLEFLHLPCFNLWDPFLEYLAGRILNSKEKT